MNSDGSRKRRYTRTAMQKKKKLAAGAALAVGAVFGAEGAQAATITVSSTADNTTVDGQCTLREALANANDDAATSPDCTAGTGTGDIINFTALTAPATITLGGSSLPVADSVILTGLGQTSLTIDAAAGSRIFTIEDDDPVTALAVQIDNMTLTNGDATGEAFDAGGAIFSAESLVLSSVTISNSVASTGGGLLLDATGNPGTLTLTNATITGNYALNAGGAFVYGGDATITNSTISDNAAILNAGGIQLTGGSVNISGTTISGNDALAGTTGGIGLYGGPVVITDTTISGNYAGVNAGGLYIYGATGSVTIANSVISGNDAGQFVGGAHISDSEATIAIRDTTISGNSAGNVTGGLYLYATGAVTLERVAIKDNSAVTYQGGAVLWNVEATISQSQITGNTAGAAGGLYLGYGAYLYLENSTIADNHALTGSVGGLGVNSSVAVIDVSTISGNTAVNGAAGNVFAYGSALYVSNSIIANGVATAGPDLVTSDSTVVISHSLIEDTTGATFTGTDNLTGVDPQLGSLQNNGGTTETLRPASTSPAVNAGTPEYSGPTYDQRGFPRPVGVVDMGAVELNPSTLVIEAVPPTAGEGADHVTIYVHRTGVPDGAVSVSYATSSGSATADADFITTAGTLNWPHGDLTPRTFDVPILEDNIVEGSETFTVTLSSPVNATLGTASAVVTITDNEPVPTVSISNATGNEENGGTINPTFNVTLSHPTTQTVTVDFNTGGVDATVNVDFQPASGGVIFPPMSTVQQITVPVINDTIDEADETFIVVISNPTNAVLGDDTGVGTIIDDDAAPSYVINDVTQLETDGATTFTFTVTLSVASEQTATIDFATAPDDATQNVDFQPLAGTLTFSPGVTSQPIAIQVLGDTLDEPNETFRVLLSNRVNLSPGDSTGVGTITDDDGPPALNISDVTLAEGTGGTTNFIFTVTLAPASGQIVSATYTLQDGNATAGSDYTGTPGGVIFGPGDTTESIVVPVTGDAIPEPDETFTVTLSNPSAATIADGVGLGTILNDDVPSLIISDVTQAEGSGNFVFTVTMTPASTQTVTVDFTTQNGTATTAAGDYAANAGTLTFAPGDTSESITVAVTNDTEVEPDETFHVVLSNPSLATIADNSGTGTILNDDAAIADLTIAKTAAGTGPFTVGQSATFDIQVVNVGPGSAPNVTVTDVLPAGTTFISATPSSGSCSGTATVVCNVGTLASGGNAQITLAVQLTAPGTISNTASAASDVTDPTPAQSTAAIAVQPAEGEAAIPTLSQWMLVALASALAAVAALKVKP